MLHVYMYVQHVDGDNANPHPTQIVVTAGGGEGLRMRFSDGCPHALAVECLGRFLDTTRSLPLFLQVHGNTHRHESYIHNVRVVISQQKYLQGTHIYIPFSTKLMLFFEIVAFLTVGSVGY